jgi:hypothetical protein
MGQVNVKDCSFIKRMSILRYEGTDVGMRFKLGGFVGGEPVVSEFDFDIPSANQAVKGIMIDPRDVNNLELKDYDGVLMTEEEHQTGVQVEDMSGDFETIELVHTLLENDAFDYKMNDEEYEE